MPTTIVIGNPKPRSRTAQAARMLAEALTGTAPDITIDVVELGAPLLGWGDAPVASAVDAVARSRLVIVASPTFKATYTGLLKLFLDQFAGGTGMQGVVAVPLMLGASPAHAMAPDLLLKPVLVELGATCPTPGLYLMEKSFEDGVAIQAFSDRWSSTVRALTRRGDES
ncbi:NADPH-dependent FMN reductase (plasmid) [Cupriavidus necator]|uniref:NADPH-dependent FMN reductase n=1 Tax=Cupriavidus necator TaxID=106590 RepID=A0A1U9V2X6_CUPNE|nr:NAD(P)H-dependent oxidoreductase [Cupriavidus necator]AQV99306.1 NADPH-dependent FMN reductase [Cupriavidus necator]